MTQEVIIKDLDISLLSLVWLLIKLMVAVAVICILIGALVLVGFALVSFFVGIVI